MSYGYKTVASRLGELKFSKKCMIVALAMIIVRIGTVMPLPFVNREYISALLSGDGLSFLNAVTGGSMKQMSVFALSVSPYITASIIIQLLCVAVPALDEIRKDGKTGADRYKKIIRYTGAGLAMLQATAMAVGLGKQGLLIPYNAGTVIAATAIWTIGAIAIILLGEFLDLLQIGNGISMILFCNIVSTIPSDCATIKEVLLDRTIPAVMAFRAGMIAVLFIAILAVCVTITGTVKKIRVSNSRKIIGFADSSFPIPLATCSVMPVIFAGSIMSLPVLISQFFPGLQNGIAGTIIGCMNTSLWFLPERPIYTIGAAFYFLLTTFFTYFYLSIGFNALEIADNFKKSGTVIPGIRPGKPTAEYIEKISTKVALSGNAIMTALILFMHLLCNASGLGTLSIAGTSIFICANVVAEEHKLIKANETLKTRKMAGFLWNGINAA